MEPLPLQAGKMYLKLFHGRKDPNQDMDDWGELGPVFGPLLFFHTTYGSCLKYQTESGQNGMFDLYEDMICYAGTYYGDWSVFYATSENSKNLAFHGYYFVGDPDPEKLYVRKSSDKKMQLCQ